VEDGCDARLAAAMRRLPGLAVFSGRTAAWLHGLESQFPHPIEATIAPGILISRRAGIRIHRCRLDIEEIVVRRGHATTSPVRTVADLATWLDLIDAVAALDAALHRQLVSLADVRCWIDSHRGWKGVDRLRRATELAEPKTESAMETRLRLLLVQAGLPRPHAQVSLYDEHGSFLGRPDLYYPDQRLGLEYDGASHRDSLAADDRRQNRLIEAGITLLRFTAADVMRTPAAVVGTVRRTLAART
jgi:Protein of unknown function (DUF559)